MAIKLSKKNTKVKKVVKKIIEPKRVLKTAATAVMAKPELTFSIPTGRYVEAVGRRKVATARVRLYESAGDFVVNKKVVGEYFSSLRNASRNYLKPFVVTGTTNIYAVTATVNGSGINSQLEAVMHGISRALVLKNADFKTLLRAEGLLTRDDRMKETRKIGMGGKARRQRQSPKR